MTKKPRLTLHFGALAKPLKVQIEEQGFIVDEDIIAKHAEYTVFVTKLYFARVITASETNSAYRRITKSIGEYADVRKE